MPKRRDMTAWRSRQPHEGAERHVFAALTGTSAARVLAARVLAARDLDGPNSPREYVRSAR
ncbi:hypothetical protein [Streptomyces iconiensis]|uniref:Uncharacterized protein n=1 Tax=Streptomyces iconiensis TaxID=1384038 RepID=A0ABT6ZYX6_9ACTN|nr:hypothetical protein [Streptomyces iconiensis]MDJ1134269.1 hypothetical protein [Streptomyces iconiensis]